jgi:glycosyltransferase involved in cell wall biosynthesis
VPRSIADKVKFLGHREDVESIVNILTIGVLCSPPSGEGISNSIMEYMAASKPVVVTRGGGTEELVLEGETGYIVEPGSVGGVVDKISILLTDTDLVRQMGHAGRKRLEDHFNLDQMVKRQIEVFDICMQPKYSYHLI